MKIIFELDIDKIKLTKNFAKQNFEKLYNHF